MPISAGVAAATIFGVGSIIGSLAQGPLTTRGGAYALLLTTRLPVEWIIVVFGVFICLLMGLAMRRHARNERTVDLRGLVEE